MEPSKAHQAPPPVARPGRSLSARKRGIGLLELPFCHTQGESRGRRKRLSGHESSQRGVTIFTPRKLCHLAAVCPRGGQQCRIRLSPLECYRNTFLSPDIKLFSSSQCALLSFTFPITYLAIDSFHSSQSHAIEDWI